MKKWIVSIIAVAFFLAASVGFYVWASRPAVTKVAPINTTSNPVTKIPPQTWKTTYFTTLLPNSWDLRNKADNQTSPTILARFLLGSSTQNSGDQLAVTIGKLPAGGLHELSDVTFRSQRPELYKSTTLASAPEGSIVFIGLSDYETDVFFAHGQNYAAIAMTGQMLRRSELDGSIDNLVKNWQWQQ